MSMLEFCLSVGTSCAARTRAGHIGPIRREIIFEPLPDSAPAEPVRIPASPPVPDPQPKEPVPDPA
jgi:hypothetical protein